MSTLDLSPDEFRTLESLRQRLATLTANLKSLQDTTLRSNPLPNPSSLQASARIAQQNLYSLQSLLSDRQDLFTRLAVHPSTNYPGRDEEMVLQTLLRKKLEPEVETWVEECTATAVRAGVDGGRAAKAAGMGEEDEDEDEEGYRPEEEGEGDPLSELWADAWEGCLERIKAFVEPETGESEDVYTAREREVGVERVRTGLKRDLEEEEEEEESDEEDEEEDGEGEKDDVVMSGQGQVPVQQNVPAPRLQGPRIEPEHMLWFGVRGDVGLPGHIESEKRRQGGRRLDLPAGRMGGETRR